MKKYERLLLFIILVMGLSVGTLFAQMEGLHGDFMEIRDGVHAGNQFRTTFFNDGLFGAINRPPDHGGEWPINSGHVYMLDGNAFIGAEVIDRNGDLKHIMSEVRGPGNNNVDSWSTGDMSPDGEWRTFLPLGKFANPDTNKIAMSKWPWAWPSYWPDISDPNNPLFSPDTVMSADCFHSASLKLAVLYFCLSMVILAQVISGYCHAVGIRSTTP